MNSIVAFSLLVGALAAPAAAADADGLPQALAALQTDAAASRARAIAIQSIQGAPGNHKASSLALEAQSAQTISECDRPGTVKWVQFASDPLQSFLLKINTDDGSRSVLLYKLLPDSSESCFEVRGPYAKGSAEFLALVALEKEIHEISSVVTDKPWLYFVEKAPTEKDFKKRLEHN